MTLTSWLEALEARHLSDLTFSEVARALRALSSTYVERRERLTRKTAFDSAGKRAAYALYYSPLHFLTVAHVVQQLGPTTTALRRVFDLGCGAGAAGTAWATSVVPAAAVTGIDAHPWALGESAFTYRAFGLDADTRRSDLARLKSVRGADAIVAGWVLNEVGEATRDHLRSLLLQAAEGGAQILVVEPIATRVAPWWPDWIAPFIRAGARADEWRFHVDLPSLLQRLDRATGLRHDELTARSLYLARRG